MPQMSPLWWTTLFIMFIMSLMMTWTMFYYLTSPSSKTGIQEKMTKLNLNWKW
uniref:ATP synthase F0 subunit 8 n=1 Tax=Inara alboguttata TaxID=1239030 RepID=A0A343W8R6_9HEMI|nr:ATP synthase F0 subunit 8 [Inara alboguttata]AVZ00756.1 ATP synthase F0 subunit 8 [Inara alboguttata]